MTFAPAQRRDQSPDKPAVRAAIANGDAVANGKIVAGDDMFVDHYRITMMDSEPPTNGRGGWISYPNRHSVITRYSTSTGAAHRLFSTFFCARRNKMSDTVGQHHATGA